MVIQNRTVRFMYGWFGSIHIDDKLYICKKIKRDGNCTKPTNNDPDEQWWFHINLLEAKMFQAGR